MSLIFECRDKSVSGHSVTLGENLSVSTAEISGATAYQVSGMITFMWIIFSFECFLPAFILVHLDVSENSISLKILTGRIDLVPQ